MSFNIKVPNNYIKIANVESSVNLKRSKEVEETRENKVARKALSDQISEPSSKSPSCIKVLDSNLPSNSSYRLMADELKDLKSKIKQARLGSQQEELEELYRDFDSKIATCFQLFVSQPLRFPLFYQLIRDYGPYSHFLTSFSLRGGLSAVFHLCFPHLKEAHLYDIEEEDVEELREALRHLPQLERLTVNWKINSFDLSLIEECSSLKSFSLVVSENTPIENIYLLPFKTPENLHNLEYIGLQQVDCSHPQLLDFLKRLPRLSSLSLFKAVGLNAKELNSLISKLAHTEIIAPTFSLPCLDRERNVNYNLSLFRLWQWQSIFSHVNWIRLEENFDPQEFQRLTLRWKEDQTDYKQMIQVSPIGNGDYTVGVLDSFDWQKGKDLLQELNEDEKIVFDNFEALTDKAKLRYTEVRPYDHNHLTAQLGFLFNASPIKCPDGRQRIATQGALDSTVKDFWKAAWLMDTRVIVMLTACKQLGQSKCKRYWPRQVNDTLKIEDLSMSITLSHEQPVMDRMGYLRSFKVKIGEEQRDITQLHIDQWPDRQGLDAENLLELVNFIDQIEAKSSGSTFIHCSAGVGRTGVLFACMIIKQMLSKMLVQTPNKNDWPHPDYLHLDVEKLLIALRQQRMSMVQTSDQLLSIIDFFNTIVKNIYLKLDKY